MTPFQIGIITNHPEGAFQNLVIRGARAVIEQQDAQLNIISFDKNTQVLRDALQPFNLAGLLIVADAIWDEDLRALHGGDLPVTLVSHRVPDLPIPSLLSNNLQGINLLTAHLVEDCGCRRFVFLDGLAHQQDAIERHLHFERAMLRYRIPPEQITYLEGGFSPSIAAQNLDQFIQAGGTMDAVVAADYLMGVAALECLQNHRIRVPDQVRVAGYGDAEEAERAELTTVKADIQELGSRAAQQLFSQLNGLRISGETTISVSLQVRRTTC